MKILELFGAYDLRKKCVEKYGEEFGKLYDEINHGNAIGNYEETIIFLCMLDKVKKEMDGRVILNRLKKLRRVKNVSK